MNSIEASDPTTQSASQETPTQISTQGASEEEVQSRTPEGCKVAKAAWRRAWASAKEKLAARYAQHEAHLIQRKRRRAEEAVGSREKATESIFMSKEDSFISQFSRHKKKTPPAEESNQRKDMKEVVQCVMEAGLSPDTPEFDTLCELLVSEQQRNLILASPTGAMKLRYLEIKTADKAAGGPAAAGGRPAFRLGEPSAGVIPPVRGGATAAGVWPAAGAGAGAGFHGAGAGLGFHGAGAGAVLCFHGAGAGAGAGAWSGGTAGVGFGFPGGWQQGVTHAAARTHAGASSHGGTEGEHAPEATPPEEDV